MSKLVAAPSVSTEVSEIIEQLKTRGIHIPSLESVSTFLTAHPELARLLIPTVEIAQNRLPKAELSLEHYTDPEIEDEYLALYARYADYNEDILQRLDHAREACEALGQGVSDLLFITTDFKPPYGI